MSRRRLRIMFDAPEGPAVIALDVDPPLSPGEVEIELEPATSRAVTTRMSEALLASLRGHCREAGGKS